jgi:hypothetical protein
MYVFEFMCVFMRVRMCTYACTLCVCVCVLSRVLPHEHTRNTLASCVYRTSHSLAHTQGQYQAARPLRQAWRQSPAFSPCLLVLPHRTLALVCLCARLYQPGLSVCLREREKGRERERESARARERTREGEREGEGEGESLAVCLTARLSQRHTSV